MHPRIRGVIDNANVQDDLQEGDRVEIKIPGTYRDQVLGMGHAGTVRTKPNALGWIFVHFDGQPEAISMMRFEIRAI